MTSRVDASALVPRARERLVRLPAPVLVFGAILSVQFGAALAAGLIRTLGPLLTVAIRLDVAALVLLLVARPSLRGRSREDWRAVVLLGLTLGAMNLSFYNAIARLPLGVVTTIEFLGPLGLAAFASRRPRDLLAVALALVGVVLVSGLLGADLGMVEPVGLAFTLAAAAGWALYILASRSVGRRWRQLDGLALAMIVAAALVTPIAIVAGGGDGIGGVGFAALDGRGLLVGASIGLLSSVVPYSLELLALRRIAANVFGILMSVEPAVAALAGFVVLGQALVPTELVGMGFVVAASALVMVGQAQDAETELAELG